MKPHRFIAWDTSSKSGAVVAQTVSDNGEVAAPVASLSLNVDAQHSEKLLWAIDQVLSKAGWKLEDVDFFGVGEGPGSFTGLRIGMTTARTLAQTLSKPIVQVSSLAALAYPYIVAAKNTGIKTLVIASTDACKGELFSWMGSSELDAVSSGEEKLLTPLTIVSEAQIKWSNGDFGRWIMVGESTDRYPEILKALPSESRWEHKVDRLGEGYSVDPMSLGLLVAQEFKRKGLSEFSGTIPNYMRASDAEIKLALKGKPGT